MMKLHSCKEVLISSDRMQLQVVIDYQVRALSEHTNRMVICLKNHTQL